MSTCIPKEIADRVRTSLERGEIDANSISSMLPEEQKALRSLLEDVVTEDIGVTASPEEIRIISEKAKVIDKAQKVLGDDIGNPLKTKENVDFFLAKKEMDDYLQSLSPAHNAKILTSTIGRGVMLSSVKSPTLNIISNMEIGFTEALTRRIARFGIRGTSNKLALQYMKMVNEVYQKTGYDISRMTTLHDIGSSGQRVLGKIVHSEGKGPIRAIGRFFEDTVFKQLMGAPDVAFSSAHFADSVNLNARKLAKSIVGKEAEKGVRSAKALELMNDAMRLNPLTKEGEILRGQAIMDAQKATWTDTTWASKTSEGIRKVLNTVSGDLRFGDYALPFVKTPANFIATGMDYAGMGIPKALFKTVKAIRTGGFAEIATKEFAEKTIPDLVRAGLGITTAAIIAYNLKADDFVGAYDPQRQQIEQLRNSTYNAVRIGNKWISTAYFGPLAVPLSAMMYAKKYGKTPGEKTFQYAKGTLQQVFDLPGVSDAADYFNQRARQPKDQTLSEAYQSTQDYVLNQAMSRLMPSFIPDIANVTDPNQRKATGLWQVFQSKIPGLRNKLPEKKTIFGDTITGESKASELFFGARVKTDRETDLVKELIRVANENNSGISFTDWDKSSSSQLAQFEQKIGKEKYGEAKDKYGKELEKLLNKLVSTKDYQKESDYEKLKDINNVDATAIKNIFKDYNFKYEKNKSSSGELLANYDKGEYEVTNKRNVFQLIETYLTGFKNDPAGAWKALTTPEKLKDVVTRPGFNKGIVQFERKKGLSEIDAGNKATAVDHKLAVVLGGTNDLSNLQVLKTKDNNLKGQLEKYLIDKVRSGEMTREQAREIDKNWNLNLNLIGK